MDEFKNGSRLYWCHSAWWQCWHLLSPDLPSYQRACTLSHSSLLFWDLNGLSRAELPGVREQIIPTRQGPSWASISSSVNDMLSPTELQSAHKTRLVLPSASWAFWWYDNAHFSNPHETNCLHFWKKLDHNVLFCLHFCHKSFSEPKMAELRFKHDKLSSVEFMTGFYSL